MSQFAIIVAVGPWDPSSWREHFQAAAQGREVRFWPQDGAFRLSSPYVICAWKADPQLYERFPDPRAVFSLGAGVDHLAPLKGRADLPIYRVIDPDLSARMAEYVTYAALYLHRQIPLYLRHQKQRVWDPPDQLAASSIRVGLMGAGVMGQAGGRALQSLGFQVTGWARTARAGSAFPIQTGRAALGAFLEQIDILVNVLPRTDDTTRLVDGAVFAQLGRRRPGPKYFVNAGRGDTVVQDDLIEALRTGMLHGAVLDVFTPEPLPADSPLWAMDNVLITPHVAADSNPLTIIPQVFKDVAELERGGKPAGVVDLGRGY